MNIYSKWNENFYKSIEEGIAYNKRKDTKKVELGADIDTLATNYKILKDLTPSELDELVISAAELNVPPQTYYELYKTTKPIKVNITKGKPNAVTDWLKQVSQIVKSNKEVYSNTRNELFGTEGKKAFTQTLFLGLNSIFDSLGRRTANLGAIAAPYEEEILAEKGLTRQDAIEFEKNGRNNNQSEWMMRGVTTKAYLKAIGSLVKINKAGLFDDEIPISDAIAKTESWLIANGVVDKNGDAYWQKTDIQVAYEDIKDAYLDEVRVQEKNKKRDLTPLEKISIAFEKWETVLGEGSEPGSLLSVLTPPENLEQNRILRESYERAQLSTNTGDYIAYLVTGNMPGRYSPQNIMYEDIQQNYDLQILQAERAFDDGQITVDQKNKIVGELYDKKDEALNELSFDPNKGISGIMGGAINLVAAYATDLGVLLSKGVGLGGKVPNNFDEVLAGAQKEMKRFVDDGGTVEEFWKKNDEILDGLSTILVEANKSGKPIFLDLINSGFNHKFAKTLSDVTDPLLVKQAFQDGFSKQYLSDMVYGGASLGKTGQFRIQAKVMSDNMLRGFAEAQLDDGITALGRRGGSRKTDSVFQNIKELMNGTDVRLANAGQFDMREVQKSVVMFARMGNLLKVPESRLNKMLLDFYDALDNGLWNKGQELYYDGLLRTEGALQMRYLFGLSDNEINEVFGKLKGEKRLYDDTVADFVKPSRTPEFYPLDEIDIITKRQATGQFENEVPIDFIRHSIDLINQFSGYTLEVPDIVTLIKSTTQRRRLRAQTLIEQEGIEKVFATARKAFDEGKPGTFWDENTPMGKEIAEIAKGLDDPGFLFKRIQEDSLSAIERGTFGAVRSVFYPLALLFRLSYPFKLALEGNIRASLLGVRSMFRSPTQFFKYLFNDSQGAIAKALGITPDTSLVGPYKKVRPVVFEGKLKGLNDKLPVSVRKTLGVFQDNAQYAFPELAELSSASPTFTFGRRIPDTGYELINKIGQKNVPTPDGLLDFELSAKYIEAYQEYFFEFIDDDLSGITAALMKKNLSYEDIGKIYQETPAIREIIEQANKMMQSRNIWAKGTIPLVNRPEDYIALAKHYTQTINNYTGKVPELLDILSTGRVGRVDLRSIDSMTPESLAIYNAKIKTLVQRNRQLLPNQVPKAKEPIDDRKTYQKFFDALFFATAQVESDLIRVPVFKQAYEHYVEGGIPFTTKTGLNKIIKEQLDPESAISLSDDIFDLVKKEYEAIKNLAPDTAITERTVPIKVFDNGDSLSIIAYSKEGQKQVTSLKRIDVNNDVLEFDLNLYNTELKVFKKQSAVADYRLGDDGNAIGVYNFYINKNEAIIDGAIPNKDALVASLTKYLDKSVDAEALVDDAIEYLTTTRGKFDKPITKQELFDLLGITGKEPNVTGLKVKLSKGKTTSLRKNPQGKLESDVGISTLNRVIGKKESRNILRKKADLEDAIDRAYAYITEHPDGWSLDLGRKKFTRVPGYYLSPYKTKELIVKTPVTREIIEKFIKDNKSLLSKQDHVLGGWVEDGKLYLDVSVKINKGVPANVVKGKDEALAKAQYLAIIGNQKGIANVSSTGVETIYSNTPGAFDVIRRAGQDLLIGSQKKILPAGKAITKSSSEAAVIANNVLESAGIKAIVDKKAGVVQILKPQTNPIMDRVFSGDYQSMLDLSDIKSASTPRVMSMEDLHERAVEYAYELHARLLYNLTERGYFSQAYRIGFAFFEAYREVVGRYYNLALANPKAVAQLGFGYRKGLEHNFIYTAPDNQQYLIVPVGGTPFEDYVKSEGRGAFTDDMSVEGSSVIAKRGIPLGALLVGGGGLFPPVGPAIALPTGLVVKNKPVAKRNLEKYIFGGYELTSAKYESIGDIPGILAETVMPSVGKNMLNVIATNLGIPGMDEDQWLSSIDTAYQVAALVRPDLSDDVVALEEVALTLATNYYQLKTWDRFINPLTPRLSILYAIEGNEVAFQEWYGKEGEGTGLVWNNFVELSVIHAFYQDIKDEYVMSLGPQGEFYALLEISKLLGLDNRTLGESFTTTALQIKGKNVSEGGILPRTRPEYEFVLDNPELAADYGPVLVLFAPGLDEGATDYGGVGYVSNLGLFRPKTPDEFYLSTQTFLASAIESATKDYWSRVIDNSTNDATLRTARKKAKFAAIDADLAEMFPMAYGNSAELNKVLGSDYETGVPNDVLIDYLQRAIQDKRFDKFENRDDIAEYLNERQLAINSVKKAKLYVSDEDAMNWIKNNPSIQAQQIREQLFTKAQQLGRKNPKFLVIFEKVFNYELTKFGLED
jgi:hypothetical protein